MVKPLVEGLFGKLHGDLEIAAGDRQHRSRLCRLGRLVPKQLLQTDPKRALLAQQLINNMNVFQQMQQIC